MLLTCAAGQLLGDYGQVSRGQDFECAPETARHLIKQGYAYRKMPPSVMYGDWVSPWRPFVTCLCVTRNRPQWLQKAIRYFQAQEYPSRELLIIADGQDIRSVVPGDDRIRIIHIEEGYTIGQKRNFGSQQAAGHVIATWDDDDYSAPQRLTDQVKRLNESERAVTGYHSMNFTDGPSRWRFERKPEFGIGTSLCYRKSWWIAHPFSQQQIGEDRDFRDVAIKAGQLISVDAGELMLGTIHAGNTEPRWLEGPSWRRVS